MPTPENGGTLSNKSLTVEREIADGVWPLCGDGPERIKILPDKLPIPDGLTSFKVFNKFCQVVRENWNCEYSALNVYHKKLGVLQRSI